MNLALSTAIAFVRSRMDEIAFNPGDMIDASLDDRNLETTVEKLLPESAEAIILSAPAGMLEPEYTYSVGVQDSLPAVFDSAVLSSGALRMVVNDASFLRLVSFKASDSVIYVTEPVPYDSPEARMQQNPYVRGTKDEPTIVRRDLSNDKIELIYYTASSRAFEFSYIGKPELSGSPATMFCPIQLETAVLNYLTGKVLETYGDQRSQSFYQKALAAIQ